MTSLKDHAMGWVLSKIHRTISLAFLLFVSGSAAATTPIKQEGIVRATLSNGLRVIIVRDALAPVVATSVNYLVGSDEAPAGFPGMAHAQEHMMFRGSPGLSADQLATIGNALGGNFNANTRESLTQYLFTVPADDVDVALNIEAARMRGVLDADTDWTKERGAIEQEVAQDLSSPGYVGYTKLRATLFAGTPYEHDALGTRDSFDKTNEAMLRSFHDKWYAPNNAILVVVGDLNPKHTLERIRQLFGNIPAKTVGARPDFSFQPVRPASFTQDTDQPDAVQLMAMRLPGLDSPDFPALEVLSDILDSQRSALYGLVAGGKALEAHFVLDPLKKASMGYAYVRFSRVGDANVIQNAIQTALDDIKRNGVSAELVEAAKLQERRQTEFQKNSIAGLASSWSDAVALYGLDSPEQDLARIEKVTVADVDRVAREYIDTQHAVTVLLKPHKSGAGKIAGSGFGGQETIALGNETTPDLPKWARAVVNRLPAPPAPIKPIVSVLPNGITLIVQPSDVSDTVSVYGHIRNRPETETPAGQDGVADVMDRLWSFGTRQLDRMAFRNALDEIGADEDAGMDFHIKVLASEFDRGTELLAANQLQPAFPNSAFEQIKTELAEHVAALQQSPGHLMQHNLRAALFPAEDPSLREATSLSVSNLTLNDVNAYYKKTVRPDLTTIVVVGKVTPDDARETIEKYFGSWTVEGPKPVTDLPRVPPNASANAFVPDDSRVQSVVVLAQTLGMSRSDPDFDTLSLGNAVLGGGFYSARLSIELRKKLGLVYSVGSDLYAGRTRSTYIVSFASDPQNVAKASSIAIHAIEDMQTHTVPVTELEHAKAFLIRQDELEVSSVDGYARAILERSDLNLPLNEPSIAARHLLRLNGKDVQSAFRKWMRPSDMVHLSLGPP